MTPQHSHLRRLALLHGADVRQGALARSLAPGARRPRQHTVDLTQLVVALVPRDIAVAVPPVGFEPTLSVV